MARLLTKKEYRKRRIRYEVAAGLFDFMGMIVGFVLVVFCVYMIATMVQWVTDDFDVNFGVFVQIVEKALHL